MDHRLRAQKLDVKDLKILAYLLQNARMSFTEIAKKVGLSKESVQYRYKQLVARNVILASYAEVDFEQLGYQVFHLLLLLDERNKEKQKQLLATLEKDPNVHKVLQYSDNWDLEIILLAKNVRDFDIVAERLLRSYEDIILQKDSAAVIEGHDFPSFPDIKEVQLKEVRSLASGEGCSIDTKDRRILECLCKDARVSTYEIGETVGVSPDTVGLRIKKLYNAGIIRRFTCRLNMETFHYDGFVFSFSTASLSSKEIHSFLQYAHDNPHVRTVKRMIGTWDVRTYAMVRDMKDLHELISDVKLRFNKIIRSYETWVIYKKPIYHYFPKILLS